MDNRRLFLWLSLAALVYLMWNAWELEFAVPPPKPSAPPTLMHHAAPLVNPSFLKSSVETPPLAPARSARTQVTVRVRTDLYRARIDLVGGRLASVDLLRYPQKLSAESPPVHWLEDQGARRLYAVSTLVSRGTSSAPGLQGQFVAPHQNFVLEKGARRLVVPLVWKHQGVTVIEQWIFHPQSYVITVKTRLVNGTRRPWQGAPLLGIDYGHPPIHSSFFDRFLPNHFIYHGAAYYNGHGYHELSPAHIQKKKFDLEATGGWLAYTNHYFLVALLPPRTRTWRYYALPRTQTRYWLGALGPVNSVLPGGGANWTARLYVGPKRQRRLTTVAPGLSRTVDYGFLSILSRPLYLLLAWIEHAVGNWGVAIILLVLLIKIIFFPLQHTSGRSMARIRAIQPRIKAIQERFKGDREQSYRATLELYKKEKVNPVSGCLPMLLQFPIYIALYWVLLASVELRHAPFALWIHDLSAPDPLYILPVLYAGTMLVQQWVNPQAAGMDKHQRRILMVMLPVMSLLFGSVMPSGLVLYWVVSGLFGIGQQWHINRVVLREAAKAHR
ncbi:MAG: membrane protein insertase YidC [Gammaproteobacteria bacterium]